MGNEDVRRAVVTMQVDHKGQKRLIAYVVLMHDSKQTTSSLREFLQKKALEYMVPSIFIFLQEIPLTKTHKADRKALAPPDWRQFNTSVPYVAPQDEVESQMVNVWKNVLGLENFGIDDHFFDIGGDSLMVMELILELAKVFHLHLPARAIINHDSIRELAVFIRQPELIHQEMMMELSLDGAGLPVYLIPGGNGDIYGMLPLTKYQEGEQPVYGLQAAGVDGRHLYKQPVEEIATQFVREIKKIQPAGPYRIIGGSFGGVVAFEMAHHLQKAGDKINLLAMIDTLPPGPRQKAKITSRLRLHWQRLRSIPISQYPTYLLNG